jgi:HK97 gp10 family phage protein
MAEYKYIQGLSELSAALKELPQRIGKSVLRGAVSAGAAVVKSTAKNMAPVATGPLSEGHSPPGTLKRAIYQKQISELSDINRQVFYVGVRLAKNGSIGSKNVKAYGRFDAYYWRWIEFGTSKMAAKPFLRPAFELSKYAAMDAIENELAKRIPEEVAKLPGAKA